MSGWPLVGRTRELSVALDAVRTDRSVAIIGPDGCGRSRLCAEVALQLTSDVASRTVFQVAGTVTARSIPLAAAAHVLPGFDTKHGEPDTRPNEWTALQSAHETVRSLAANSPVTIIVDDMHLLDALSATLVDQLSAAGVATVVATCPTVDASCVRSLWKDRDGLLLELGPLSDVEVRELAEAIVGGPFDDDACGRLSAISVGNPLHLRETIFDLQSADVLRRRRGVWVWEGDIVIGPRLHDLATRRLGDTPPGARQILEALAVAEPLPLAALRHIDEEQALDGLIQRGLVTVTRSPGGGVRLSHRIDAEILRAELAADAAVHSRRVVVDALDLCGADIDPLAAALLRLDAGLPLPHHVLLRAADTALGRGAPELAIRFGEAAVAAGAGGPARVRIGEGHVLLGRPSDAERELTAIDLGELGDDALCRAVTARIDALVHGLGDIDLAASVVAAALPLFATEPARSLTLAVWATALGIHGRHDESLAIAERLYRDADLRTRMRVWPAVSIAAIQRGDIANAVDGLERLMHAYQSEQELGLADVDLALVTSMLIAYMLDGRLDDADELAGAIAGDASPRLRGGARVFLDVIRGRAAMLRGSVRSAQVHLRAAVAGHDRIEAIAWRSWALALLGEACVLTGDAAAALALEDEIDQAAAFTPAAFVHDVQRSRAWLRVAQGSPTAAARDLIAVADRAGAADLPASELAALHDALRLGAVSGAADRIIDLGRRVSSRWVIPFSLHAEGLLANDPAILAGAADEFASMGALLCAAEAAVQASLATGAPSSKRAIRLSALAEKWKAECEGASTPVIAASPASSRLTAREREVGALAARGLTSVAIATELGLSRRTVDNLLGRVYDKLGIHGRDELRAVLPPRW